VGRLWGSGAGVPGALECDDGPFWVDEGDPPPAEYENAVTPGLKPDTEDACSGDTGGDLPDGSFGATTELEVDEIQSVVR
jgi:hypothetical protein